ncbi:hypothetical protein RhiJN_02309 [Ceratobasidium sp. AG-Ba]|nr:hypothetical protein RhiJN_02309 [Ceratobasidium sp. AG-Ba]
MNAIIALPGQGPPANNQKRHINDAYEKSECPGCHIDNIESSHKSVTGVAITGSNDAYGGKTAAEPHHRKEKQRPYVTRMLEKWRGQAFANRSSFLVFSEKAPDGGMMNKRDPKSGWDHQY